MSSDDEDAVEILNPDDVKRASIMIKKSHYKSTHKVLSYWVKFGGLQVTDENKDYYKEVIEEARKSHPYNDDKSHVKKHCYVHIFSPFRHAYQMDLIDQSRDARTHGYPPYFYIFINVNTKYAFAYPMDSKTTQDYLTVLKKFLNEGDPDCLMLTSDEERAFVSKAFEDYCTKRGISQRIVNQQHHTTLSIVDRFIRTLRDMNTPPKKSNILFSIFVKTSNNIKINLLKVD